MAQLFPRGLQAAVLTPTIFWSCPPLLEADLDLPLLLPSYPKPALSEVMSYDPSLQGLPFSKLVSFPLIFDLPTHSHPVKSPSEVEGDN